MWIVLLVIGVLACSAIFFYWTHFPIIGIIAGVGYLCGYMRCLDRDE